VFAVSPELIIMTILIRFQPLTRVTGVLHRLWKSDSSQRACFLVGIALLGLTGCRGQLFSQPPIHPNLNMDHQKKVEAQEESLFFRDRRGMRPLVKGVVARGWLRANRPWHEGRDSKGNYVRTLPSIPKTVPQTAIMDRLGIKPGTPLQLNKALLKRGRERFNIFCTACHGYNGNGQGLVTKYSQGLNPTNLHTAYVREMATGQIYEAIAKGVRSMPSYSPALETFDRWAVVAYVRALQLSRVQAVVQKGPKQ
ncbi:MAG: cytochrome c, partial [Myxococcota bacterium]